MRKSLKLGLTMGYHAKSTHLTQTFGSDAIGSDSYTTMQRLEEVSIQAESLIKKLGKTKW